MHPLSVLRGFSKAELDTMMKKHLKMTENRIIQYNWKWAFRWLLIGYKENTWLNMDNTGTYIRKNITGYKTRHVDLAIAGGGLAGLTLAIQAAKAGLKVAVFEKETYPFHRVCGEYISMESFPFLESLGLPLGEMELPRIKKLRLSAPNGQTIENNLPLGGFGISRYLLDYRLSIIAKECGVSIYENTRVNQIRFDKKYFSIRNHCG